MVRGLGTGASMAKPSGSGPCLFPYLCQPEKTRCAGTGVGVRQWADDQDRR